jgi:Ankyrin repeat
LAVFLSNVNVTRILLRAGADSSATDCNAHTPLHDAAIQGKMDVITEILKVKGVNKNAVDRNAVAIWTASSKTGFDGKMPLFNLYELCSLFIAVELHTKANNAIIAADRWASEGPENSLAGIHLSWAPLDRHSLDRPTRLVRVYAV